MLTYIFRNGGLITVMQIKDTIHVYETKQKAVR